MDRKHERDPRGDRFDRVERGGEGVAGIHVGRPVQGEHAIAARREPEAIDHVGGSVQGVVQRVDHHVADEDDALRGNSLGVQVGLGIVRRDQQQIGELVGEDAVDLLGHGPVAGAQAGFDVGDGDAELGGCEGRGQGAGDVADDDEELGAVAGELCLHGEQDRRGDLGVGGAVDLEHDIRLRDPEIAEEHLAHAGVMMLSRVNESGRDVPAFELPPDRRDLHEVRACPGDDTDHGSAWGLEVEPWVSAPGRDASSSDSPAHPRDLSGARGARYNRGRGRRPGRARTGMNPDTMANN